MNQDRTKRKLTAIFSADVVGYSRLMEADEAWTIKNLDENKRLIGKFIEEYGGRVIDAIGDNLLAEFNSVINSVECAVKIQQELKKINDTLVEERRMHFRIGVNLGDVVEEDGRIYGSGVNIASRLEGLAEPGGICISGRTYDHIKTRLGLGYKYLGEHNVKNIDEPIRIYRLLMEPKIAGKVIGEKRAPSRASHRIAMAAVIILLIALAVSISWIMYSHQSRKIESASEASKTIAVLPFDDLSPEKDQEFFVLGLSEEILNSLCQIPNLGVVGKTSSFSFKGKDKTIQEIASVLGVDHILEGSVRKAGYALRINAQLVRASDGLQLWSEIYDRELKDIFEVQENIAATVADALKLTLGIDKSVKQLGGTENIEAYELYLTAKGQIGDMMDKGQMDQGASAILNPALKSLDAAIELDPEFAGAWTAKAHCHWLRLALIPMPADRVASETDSSLNAALRAIELEPNLAEGYFSLGLSRFVRGDFTEAELAYRKGMELAHDPIIPFDYAFDMHSIAVGYLKRASEIVEAAQQIDPLNQTVHGRYIWSFGLLGDIKRAEEEYDHGRALFGDPWLWGDFFLTLARLGSKDVVSRDEIIFPGPIHDAGKEHLDSPKEGLAELHQLYSDYNSLSENQITNTSVWAAYFGDPEFAMDAMEKGIRRNATGLFKIWYPVMHEVRQLPRFKEFVREIGIVDYWKEYGWPDLCRPVGDDDFVCD